MQENIDQRGDWLLEIDNMLFGNQDWIPVITPEHILIKTKALSKSKKSPKASANKKVDKGEEDDDEEDEAEDNVDLSPPIKSKKAAGSTNLLMRAIEKQKIEHMAEIHYVDPKSRDKKVYNTIQRIQDLMWLDTNHIDSEELVR